MGSDTEDVASTDSGILIKTETMVSEEKGPRCFLLALFILWIKRQKGKKHLLYGFPVRM